MKKNISLKKFSTFNIGGKAEYFVWVRSPERLIKFVKWAKSRELYYRVISGGSNIVFPDEGIKGLIIKFWGGKIIREGNKITIDASVPLARAVRSSISYGFKGLETLSGIPGSVGGAVYGNAGAYGRSISDSVWRVQVWDPSKERIFWVDNNKCDFRYRSSLFKKKDWIILRTTLSLKKGNKKNLSEVSRKIIKTRLKKYKPGLKCPGSFFKNVLVSEISKKSLNKIDESKIIEGKIPAGYLLEEVGAKGMKMGGIKIADFHGNLFVNAGNGTARDVKKISKILKDKVKKRFGIELKEEVRYF